MKVLTVISLLFSSVLADRPSYPSAWWSGSRILAGKQKYVTTTVSTDELVQAFSKNSPLLISHKENVSPEVVLLVVCDKLQKDNFMTYGAMKSFEHVITRSKSSVIIPQTMAAEHSARDILAASASLYLDDALDRESHTWYIDGVDKKMERHFTSVDKFLDASHNIFSNGQTEFVVVSLPKESADQIIEKLDTQFLERTSGNYLAGLISDSKQAGINDTQESAPAARKLLATAFVPPPMAQATADTIRMTPAILLGVILSFVMFIFLYVGFCGMMDLGVNDQFWDIDKADRGRPLLGKVEE